MRKTEQAFNVTNIQNIRKNKYVNVAYWIIYYALAFLYATKYFIFEVGRIPLTVADSGSLAHICLVVAVILFFFFINRKSVNKFKKVNNCLIMSCLLIGTVWKDVGTSLAYYAVVGSLFGFGASALLLNFIYELNNAERFYSVVLAHLLTALLVFVPYFCGRQSLVFNIVSCVLAAVCTVLVWFEKNTLTTVAPPQLNMTKNLYISVVLTIAGGLFGYGATLCIVNKAALTYYNYVIPYYTASALTAAVYWAVYRYLKSPVSVTLNIGVGASVFAIASYFLAQLNPVFYYVATAAGGVVFMMCMTNMYYVCCHIMRKYKSAKYIKIVTIGANSVGGVGAILLPYLASNFSDAFVNVTMLIAFLAMLLILVMTTHWSPSISDTEDQSEYAVYDIVSNKAELYEMYGLTPREIEVAEQFLLGKTVKEVAQAQFVSIDTIKTQRTSVYKKLGVSSRTELNEKLS